MIVSLTWMARQLLSNDMYSYPHCFFFGNCQKIGAVGLVDQFNSVAWFKEEVEKFLVLELLPR